MWIFKYIEMWISKYIEMWISKYKEMWISKYIGKWIFKYFRNVIELFENSLSSWWRRIIEYVNYFRDSRGNL